MARKQRRASSGAPGFTNKATLNQAPLNPLGVSQGGKNPLFLDVTAARDYHEQNSEWRQFWRNAEQVQRFGKTVRPRT